MSVHDVIFDVMNFVCCVYSKLDSICVTFSFLKGFFRAKTIKMDTSKLPRIQDEERESQFGYVHGVSGPGLAYFPFL